MRSRAAQVLAGLGKLLLREQRLADAVDLLWPALKVVPQQASGPVRFHLALALSLQGQHAAAEALLQQVLEVDPAFTHASICLSSCQQQQGKLAEAIETLQRVAEAQPDIAEWCTAQMAEMRTQRAAADPAPAGSGPDG